jgi:GT2 family glycosyltransferase
LKFKFIKFLSINKFRIKFPRLYLFAFFLFSKKIIFIKKENPLINVIILTWNKPEITLITLSELSKQNLYNCNLIIIDNGSGFFTQKLLSRLRGLTILKNRTNLGYSVGVNQGLKLSNSQINVLLNNDAIPENGWNSKLESIYKLNPKFGIIGGKVVDLKGKVLEAGSSFWEDGICFSNGRSLAITDSRANRFGTFDYCSGAFMAINKDVTNEIGYFDEIFSPAYYEDTDFCLRASRAEFPVQVSPNILILHFEHKSTPKNLVQPKIETSWAKFTKKHEIFLTNHPVRPLFDLTKIEPICTKGNKMFIFSDYKSRNQFLNSELINTLIEYSNKNYGFITFFNCFEINVNTVELFECLPKSNVEILERSERKDILNQLKLRRDEMNYLVIIGIRSFNFLFDIRFNILSSNVHKVFLLDFNVNFDEHLLNNIMDFTKLTLEKNCEIITDSDSLFKLVPVFNRFNKSCFESMS